MGKKPPTKGAKAKKGAAGRRASRGAGNRQNNPRAFKAASGAKSQARKAHRALEKQERQYHVQLTDRSGDASVPAPYVVAVVGPQGSGKSTLIRRAAATRARAPRAPRAAAAAAAAAHATATAARSSLVKHWTKQNLAESSGPITVVTGKQRRLTLIECPNDLNSMCDVAKVAPATTLRVDTWRSRLPLPGPTARPPYYALCAPRWPTSYSSWSTLLTASRWRRSSSST